MFFFVNNYVKEKVYKKMLGIVGEIMFIDIYEYL